MKTVNVYTEIDIKAFVNKVANYASNPDNAPEWYVNIKSAKWLTPKQLTVGSQFAFKAQFLGRNLAYTYEVIEYIPNTKMVMRTTNGPFPMETIYIWQKVDNGYTHMTLQNTGRPSGFSKLFAPFIASAMKRNNNKDLLLLKKIIEKQ